MTIGASLNNLKMVLPFIVYSKIISGPINEGDTNENEVPDMKRAFTERPATLALSVSNSACDVGKWCPVIITVSPPAVLSNRGALFMI